MILTNCETLIHNLKDSQILLIHTIEYFRDGHVDIPEWSTS